MELKPASIVNKCFICPIISYKNLALCLVVVIMVGHAKIISATNAINVCFLVADDTPSSNFIIAERAACPNVSVFDI